VGFKARSMEFRKYKSKRFQLPVVGFKVLITKKKKAYSSGFSFQ